MLVRLAKLVADVCRNTGLDAAGAERDLKKSERQQKTRLEHVRDRRAYQGQGGVAAAIDDRQPEDDPEFPEKRIGQEGAEDRKNIKRRDKRVVPAFGLMRRHH